MPSIDYNLLGYNCNRKYTPCEGKNWYNGDGIKTSYKNNDSSKYDMSKIYSTNEMK